MKTLIKTLSKLLSLAIVINIISSIKPTVVSAQTLDYMRALEDGIVVYSDSTLNEPLFEIPNTYYVKVESRLGTVLKISYGDGTKDCPVIIGYVDESKLTTAKTMPTTPFTIIKVSTDTSDILFNDVELKNP